MANAPCMIQSVKLSTSYRNECFRNLQASIEYVYERNVNFPNITDFARYQCCTSNKWQNCIGKHIREKCGQDAADVFPLWINNIFGNLIKDLCSFKHFDPENSNHCLPKLFIPPKEFVPKGYKSNNYLSHHLSILCPNVAWGIFPKRDF